MKPELMSPAGYWPQLRTAIQAGADAVYFGLNRFSARAKVGFAVESLPDVMGTLHEHGVKGFVTFNTLVFDDELAKAEQAIAAIARAGADAIIVQDTGIARLAAAIAPDLDVHGSTQMSITSAQGADFAASMGCSRVVLGRELSLKDIQKIRQATDVELEVFVHGALCVSYSGQCFSSEAWGGRSANRGKCAQACRLAYDLIVDGQHRDLGDQRYLLSPGDLYALEQVPELVRLGIACLKIEGRYKDENYVAVTTAAYRKAIDDAVAGINPGHADSAQKQKLEQVYSRGLGPHFIHGVNHQQVVKARSPRHRGLLVGKVMQVAKHSVTVQIEHEIHAGDGLVFDAADWRSPDEPEEGGNVYEVRPTADDLREMRFGSGEIDFGRIRVGDWVWRTNDPRLLVQLKPMTKMARPKSGSKPGLLTEYTRPVRMLVTARLGEPLQLSAELPDESITVSVRSESLLMPAQKHGLDVKRLEEQLGRLGGTPFHLQELELKGDPEGTLFLQVSQLNELRRKAVRHLLAERKSVGAARPISQGVVDHWFETQRDRKASADSNNTTDRQAALHLLVRTPEQLQAAIQCRPATITLDYLELYGLRPSVDRIRDAGLVPRVASPRILKPAEQNVIRFLLSLEAEIVVRSAGLLNDLLKISGSDLPKLIGDFSLNAANVVAAQSWLDHGLAKITPTYDLNSRQIQSLCRWIDPESIEVIAYSHLPVFHTEHCVFCRFMSDGTDNTNCGHPCEKHRIALRDKTGRQHPVMADVGCRNTIFGAEAQFSAVAMPAWLRSGITDYRLEFVHENPEQVTKVVSLFENGVRSDMAWESVERSLKRVSPTGITEGSLFVPLKTR